MRNYGRLTLLCVLSFGLSLFCFELVCSLENGQELFGSYESGVRLIVLTGIYLTIFSLIFGISVKLFEGKTCQD